MSIREYARRLRDRQAQFKFPHSFCLAVSFSPARAEYVTARGVVYTVDYTGRRIAGMSTAEPYGFNTFSASSTQPPSGVRQPHTSYIRMRIEIERYVYI